jgi:transposase
MWAEPRARRIFAYTQPTDMRKSFQGLLALVQQIFVDEDPHSGHLFVFVNRKGNYIKALVWDRTGFALYAKRLERGRFVFPSELDSQELSEKAFRFLIDGIPLGVRR